MSSSPARRLSARRGSQSALDPFNQHPDLNLNPNRSSSSKLTIVRVSPTPITPPPTLHDPPSPALSQRRLHRRIAPSQSSHQAQDQNTQPQRLSFAFSSFSPQGPAPGGPAAAQASPPIQIPSQGKDGSHSPSSSPRLRPASPRLTGAPAFPSKPRLNPEQLVELARQSTTPRALAQAFAYTQSQSQSQSAVASSPRSGPSSPRSPLSSPYHGPAHSSSTQPATFTPLPDDIFLPFIDRPTEVTALISSPPDVKLFTLLAQTFPKSDFDPIPTSADSFPIELPRDPARWTYRQLVQHLTQFDRDIAPDFIWAIAARKCILSHSELIWERVKGALGVPPELDIDYDFNSHDSVTQERIDRGRMRGRALRARSDASSSLSSIDTSDISDDGGHAARGHWDDWDAVIDSPVLSRAPSNAKAYVMMSRRAREARAGSDADAQFRAQVDERLRGLSDVDSNAPAASEPSDTEADLSTIAPTPADARAHTPPVETEFGEINKVQELAFEEQREYTSSPYPTEDSYVTIEPLLAPLSGDVGINSHPPPLSLPTSLTTGGEGLNDGLGDIAEGAEEEEEEEDEKQNEQSETGDEDAKLVPDVNEDDAPLVAPSQIQGLRISTAPLPAQASAVSIPSPISPLPPYPYVYPVISSAGEPLSQSNASSSPLFHAHSRSASFSHQAPTPVIRDAHGTHSRSGSFSSSSSVGPFRRSESSGSLAARMMGSSVILNETLLPLSLGDRAPGNPLFPSNFARLAKGAIGPSSVMRANVPNSRYQVRAFSQGAIPGVKSGMYAHVINDTNTSAAVDSSSATVPGA